MGLTNWSGKIITSSDAKIVKNYLEELAGFLVLNEKEILTHAGKVSHKEMEAKVRKELERFNKKTTTKQIEGPKDS